MMERSEILTAMSDLKLFGMKCVFRRCRPGIPTRIRAAF